MNHPPVIKLTSTVYEQTVAVDEDGLAVLKLIKGSGISVEVFLPFSGILDYIFMNFNAMILPIRTFKYLKVPDMGLLYGPINQTVMTFFNIPKNILYH